MKLKKSHFVFTVVLILFLGHPLQAGSKNICKSLFIEDSFRPQDMQILTSRLKLRILNSSDLNSYSEVLRSEKIKKMANDRAWEGFTPRQIKENFSESLRDSRDSRSGSYVLTILDKANDDKIGFIYLSLSAESSHEAEIAYEIIPAFWGQKFASEAIAALLPLCRQFGVRRLIAKVAQSNLGSARVLEKNGFEFESFEQPSDLTSIYRNEPDSVFIKHL